MRDWKIWINCVLTIGIFTPLYSIALFLPTIVKELGYSDNTAQLMTVPIYVGACVCTLLSNWLADKAGQRGAFMLVLESLAILGLTLLISTGTPHVQYGGAFFSAAGMSHSRQNVLV
jgi:MFS family permease